MELLLTYEASCNAADEKGSSPLHLAAWAGFAAIVDTLLVHGPSVANANLTVRARAAWPATYNPSIFRIPFEQR